MADKILLNAAARNEFGKGASRRLRRDGQIPVVLYGHGTDPQHLSLDAHATFLALRGNANALVTLDIDGKEQMALPKDIQVDAVSRAIEHVDFIIVRAGEKVTVDVTVLVEGESAPGTIHTVEAQTLSLTAPATRIPESVTVSVEGLEDGTVVRVEDLTAPEGSEFQDEPETSVVVIATPRVAEEDLETPVAEGEEGESEEAAGSAEDESSDDE
jgi:large subunit ribosomal protein L25